MSNNSNKEQNPLKLTKIQDIESLYKNIDQSNKLELSPNIKFKHIGGSSRLIQFICSWQRKHKEVFIILNKQTDIDANAFYKSEVLLVAFYLATEVLQGDKEIRKELLKKFIPFVKNMNSPFLDGYLTKKGRESKFLFLQKAENEFLKLFYDNEQIKSKENIQNVIDGLIHFPDSAIRRKQFTGDLNSIKEVIYELISNTDKHGRRSTEQTEIHKNIRGFYLDIHPFTDQNRKPFLENQKEYECFLENVKQVLVVSIFDSGEGIVKKYIETISNTKEQDMSFEEKKETLLEVFLPKTTSSKVPNSGMGLTYVENNIKTLKGLLSIKTNTLEYFLTPNENKEHEAKFTEHQACVGTSVVILIPLIFKSE